MTAACRFVHSLREGGVLGDVTRIIVKLYGSLALTGKGHATDTAIMLGLGGSLPSEVDPEAAARLIAGVRSGQRLKLAGTQAIDLRPARNVEWLVREKLPAHPNALTLVALDATNATSAKAPTIRSAVASS